MGTKMEDETIISGPLQLGIGTRTGFWAYADLEEWESNQTVTMRWKSGCHGGFTGLELESRKTKLAISVVPPTYCYKNPEFSYMIAMNCLQDSSIISIEWLGIC